MLLNIRRRVRTPQIENRAFYFFAIDSALLIILILNCISSIIGLIYTLILYKELMKTKCYFRIFTPIIFVTQFIPIFWMFKNDSPKAAFIALYCEFIGTIGLMAGNLGYCSLEWKYEALVIYLPRILSLYVYLKALMFYSYQQRMFALIDTDPETSSNENDEELTPASSD
uniref:Uncharacterized protein n=1 Tax=Panagrolaimus davidi TaxID=227884 RepID=A0A914PQX9_9BILA